MKTFWRIGYRYQDVFPNQVTTIYGSWVKVVWRFYWFSKKSWVKND